MVLAKLLWCNLSNLTRSSTTAVMFAWYISVCTCIAHNSSFCQVWATINNKISSTALPGPPSHLTVALEPTALLNPPRTQGQAQATEIPSEGEPQLRGDFIHTDNSPQHPSRVNCYCLLD